MTEIELSRVDIKVGLSGPLVYMDGSLQAVRQLRSLASQVRMKIISFITLNVAQSLV